MNNIKKIHNDRSVCGCPCCGSVLNAATNTDGSSSGPEKDDITVCFYCGALLLFNEDLTTREAPDGYLEDIRAEDPEQYALILDIIIKIKAR